MEEEAGGCSSSPLTFTDIVYKWLDIALDYGIPEKEYWEMTIAELIRAVESKKRVQLEQAREKARFDYVLADLVGRSVGRLYSSVNNYPSIANAYPSLFTTEEVEQEMIQKKDELSALRFKQFAQLYNKNLKEAAKSE